MELAHTLVQYHGVTYSAVEKVNQAYAEIVADIDEGVKGRQPFIYGKIRYEF